MYHLLKRRFHTRYLPHYRHARKLFFFDLLLVFSTLLLGAISLAWLFYDPTIVDDIALTIDVSQATPRFTSGEQTTITVFYNNTSDKDLRDAAIHILAPEGYLQSSTTFFSIGDITKHATGTIELSHLYYAPAGQTEPFRAILQYRQADATFTEQVVATQLVTMSEGNVSFQNIVAPQTIVPNQQVPLSITLSNNTAALTPTSTLTLDTDQPVENTFPLVIPPFMDTYTVTGTMTIPATPLSDQLTATLRADQAFLTQDTAVLPLTIISPSLQAELQPQSVVASQGETVPLTLSLSNNSLFAKTITQITIPYHPYIAQVTGTKTNDLGYVIATNLALPANDRIQTTIPIHLASLIRDKNPILQIPTRVHYHVDIVPQTTFHSEVTSDPVTLSGNATTRLSGRYFTAEGDQLGRGPLPPRVGKETKYWALLEIQNIGTDKQQLRVTLPLAPGVRFSGRKSLSHGIDIVQEGQRLYWQLPYLASGETVYLGIELAVTPQATDIGSFLPLVQAGTLTLTDIPTGRVLTRQTAPISTNIAADAVAQTYGTRVANDLPLLQ